MSSNSNNSNSNNMMSKTKSTRKTPTSTQPTGGATAPTTTSSRGAGGKSSGGGRSMIKSVVQGMKKAVSSFDIKSLDTNNLIFDTLTPFEKIDDKSGRKFTFHISNLWYSLNDNTVSKVQIELPRLYCYGISSFENDSNYTCTFVLGDRDGPNDITEPIKRKLDEFGAAYLMMLEQNRETLNLYKDDDLNRKKLLYSPLYKWKSDRGQNIGSPTLRTKLWQSQFDTNGNKLPESRVITTFYDGFSIEKNGDYRIMDFSELYNPEAERQTPFYARATIVIQSAFIGQAVCNFKVVLTEVVVFKVRQTFKKLMARPKNEDVEFAAKLREEMGVDNEDAQNATGSATANDATTEVIEYEEVEEEVDEN